MTFDELLLKLANAYNFDTRAELYEGYAELTRRLERGERPTDVTVADAFLRSAMKTFLQRKQNVS